MKLRTHKVSILLLTLLTLCGIVWAKKVLTGGGEFTIPRTSKFGYAMIDFDTTTSPSTSPTVRVQVDVRNGVSGGQVLILKCEMVGFADYTTTWQNIQDE